MHLSETLSLIINPETLVGISINIDPDLSHFEGIVPCGIADHGVTSLWDLGNTASLPEVDTALRQSFEDVFGRQTIVEDARHQ